MVYSLRFFSSSKCSLFHNSNVFGSCIIHILVTECAKIKKNSGTKKLNMVYTLRFFSSSKCSFFHNSNVFGSCIIHIFYTVCAKIKKKNFGAKRLRTGSNQSPPLFLTKTRPYKVPSINGRFCTPFPSQLRLTAHVCVHFDLHNKDRLFTATELTGWYLMEETNCVL